MKTFIPIFFLLVLIGCHDPKAEIFNKYLSVYPNPVHQQVYVSVYHSGKPFKLRAFDNEGKERVMTELQVSDLDHSEYLLSPIVPGTYYFTLDINNLTERKTIISL